MENQKPKLNINTAQNKFHSDNCFQFQQVEENKSIFDYVTNTNMFINKSECFDTTPPFLSYIPRGIQSHDVDIENDLRNSNRYTTKCNFKYQPTTSNLAENLVIIPNPILKKECVSEAKIIPYGYVNKLNNLTNTNMLNNNMTNIKNSNQLFKQVLNSGAQTSSR